MKNFNWVLLGLRIANGLLHAVTLGITKLESIVANAIESEKTKAIDTEETKQLDIEKK